MPDEQVPPGNAVHRVGIDAARRHIGTVASEASARRTVALVLIVLDLAVCLVPMLLRAGKWRSPDDLRSTLPLLALGGCCWLALYVVGAYRLREIRRGLSPAALVAAGCLGALAGLVAYKLILPQSPPGSDSAIRFTATAFAAVALFGLWAAFSRGLAGVVLARRDAAAKVLFVGPPEGAADLAATLQRAGHPLPMAVFCDDREGARPLAEIEDELAGRLRAVVLAVPPDRLPMAAVSSLIHARLADVPVIGPSQLVEELCERTPIMLGDHAWMLEEGSINPGRSAVYTGAKRLIDLCAAVVGIALCALPMLATALAVKLTSPGPVFFTQVREGRFKRPFRIVKFRTMRTDAEKAGAQWASKNDPRVTSIGAFLRKSRLDELPQFWNVLMGDMSLVGPRPERPEFNQMLVERIPWYDLRHLAKPGLTGWAQVCYPYGASVEDAVAKLEYEVYWMKHASLRFDLRIILRTLAVVVGLRGR